MRKMFDVLEKSIVYRLDNSNEKLEMTVEVLLKHLLGNPNTCTISVYENATHVTPIRPKYHFLCLLDVWMSLLETLFQTSK